jgi:hypothetical protein
MHLIFAQLLEFKTAPFFHMETLLACVGERPDVAVISASSLV